MVQGPGRRPLLRARRARRLRRARPGRPPSRTGTRLRRPRPRAAGGGRRPRVWRPAGAATSRAAVGSSRSRSRPVIVHRPSRPAVELSFLLEVAEKLQQEERIAAGLPGPGRPGLELHLLTAARCQEGGDLFGVEALDPELLVPRLPGPGGEGVGQRVGPVEVDVPIRADQQEPLGGGQADEVAEQRNGAAIGPVEVVEQHDERSPAGPRHQEPADAVEEAVPFLLRWDRSSAGLRKRRAGRPARVGRRPRRPLRDRGAVHPRRGDPHGRSSASTNGP